MRQSLRRSTLQNQHPIAYASRTLSETETLQHNRKELLAVLWACQHFRPYIYGRKFNLETDHQPLTWLSKLKEPNAKLTRWRLRLQEYDYDIKHTKGRENKVADALSRIELQNNESNAATVHSNNDDDETGIPIVDGFAHSRKNRIFLQESPTPKWRRDKNDVYIKIPLVNFDTEFSKNWKKYIDPKKTDYAVVTQNEKLFYKLSEFYRKNVDKNSLKLKRYTEILTEINDREQQLKLMKSAHENNDAHIGSTLMYETLKKQYYWKKLKDDVLKYVHDCSICQRNKYERRPPKTPLEYTITPEAPLQIWHIDTLVIDGTQYLTIIDKFTKYFAAEKIEGNDSISYIRSLTKIIKYLGKPKHVIHDPDKLMNSLTFKEHLTNLLSIDVHQTSIRHHTSNGDIERAHSTIIEKYRVIRELHPGEDKEELMALTITCYNSTEHSVTKCTPHQALFGIEPNQIEIPDEAILLQNFNKKRYDLLRNLHNTMIDNMDLAKKTFETKDQIYTPKIEYQNIIPAKPLKFDENKEKLEQQLLSLGTYEDQVKNAHTEYIPATFHDVNTAVCNTSKTKEVRPRDLCKDAPRCPDEPNKEAFNDARWMTGQVGHPRPPSASHAPQTPVFQTKEP
ncbi:Retrovirus-related Pol polyprotein from transposon 17.6 [Eumeta japonica]|uniref:RNA-directed DNA polymerase n=1 Tax=Eumeta variegata TaxID=151549 RepID=A0A4C1WN88_EUMVA|nr:Retrovirus-related Pol polyprotein from transposon 17.6 [Eumeta japonica]